jgi:hypothetical protein
LGAFRERLEMARGGSDLSNVSVISAIPVIPEAPVIPRRRACRHAFREVLDSAVCLLRRFLLSTHHASTPSLAACAMTIVGDAKQLLASCERLEKAGGEATATLISSRPSGQFLLANPLIPAEAGNQACCEQYA